MLILSSSAAEISTTGRFPTTIKNLKQVTKGKLKEDLLEAITSIVFQRNRIVHELDQSELTKQEVEDAFSLAINFIKELENVAVELGVPIDANPSE